MAGSGTIDTSGHLWVEEGDQRLAMVAEVAPVLPIHQTYSYVIPDELAGQVAPGQRVMVPVGRAGRPVAGFVVGIDQRPWDSTLRPITELVEAESYLTPELIALGRQIAEHYVCPLGRTLKAITPNAVRQQRGLKTVRYASLIADVESLREAGARWSERRRKLIDALAASADPIRVDSLLKGTGASSAMLRTLAKEEIVEVTSRKEVQTTTGTGPELVEPDFELNDEQRAAVGEIDKAIDAAAFGVTLLFGVSGSGKTEVYIRAIRRVVAQGRQAILLVPEIVLTTQLVQRLSSRLPDLAISHSGLTEVQRSLLWRQTAEGVSKVVIGTRSAVFAPCPNLGLICIDEEQETSYKNLRAPRFHVRDVAIMRAQQLRIPVVLGSATPSVEMWYHSEHRSDYHRIHLRRRVKALPMPKVQAIDMREEQAGEKRTVVFSRLMEHLLEATLERGEQALILMNRRGFANRIYCPACGTRITCPNCQVGLVVHRATGRSACHHCHTYVATPEICPDVACGQRLVHLGSGTQRVEDVLAERFPKARISRVDSDTMRHRDHYEGIVRDFEAREIDVLVGTQMIAKGLDFPFVSFVGVVHADTDALLGGFRASERLFQLITQVAGRAGRFDAPGRVVVQTTAPDLPALQFALTHDYEAFVADELKMRQQAGLPPFRRLARIVVEHAREETAGQEADALAERLAELVEKTGEEGADLMGPNPCVLARLRGKYRFELLVRTLNATGLRRLMTAAQVEKVLATKGQTTIVDVDPVSLM